MRSLVPLLFIGFLCFGPNCLFSQLVLGQYEDEAPLRSWNILGRISAAGLAMGGIQVVMPSDSSVGMSNPALLEDLPRFTLSLGGTHDAASLYRFSIVNTGILETTENLSINRYSFL